MTTNSLSDDCWTKRLRLQNTTSSSRRNLRWRKPGTPLNYAWRSAVVEHFKNRTRMRTLLEPLEKSRAATSFAVRKASTSKNRLRRIIQIHVKLHSHICSQQPLLKIQKPKAQSGSARNNLTLLISSTLSKCLWAMMRLKQFWIIA